MRSSDPAPTALDRQIRRIFSDDEPTGLGSGWVAGVVSLLGGALGFFGVLCLHFPQLFTAPVLRSHYPVTLLRGVLQTVLIASVMLGLFNVARRRRKILGLTGIFLAVSAMALGGAAGGPVPRRAGAGGLPPILDPPLLPLALVPLAPPRRPPFERGDGLVGRLADAPARRARDPGGRDDRPDPRGRGARGGRAL